MFFQVFDVNVNNYKMRPEIISSHDSQTKQRSEPFRCSLAQHSI